jgi:hypothetical protein
VSTPLATSTSISARALTRALQPGCQVRCDCSSGIERSSMRATLVKVCNPRRISPPGARSYRTPGTVVAFAPLRSEAATIQSQLKINDPLNLSVSRFSIVTARPRF